MAAAIALPAVQSAVLLTVRTSRTLLNSVLRHQLLSTQSLVTLTLLQEKKLKLLQAATAQVVYKDKFLSIQKTAFDNAVFCASFTFVFRFVYFVEFCISLLYNITAGSFRYR